MAAAAIPYIIAAVGTAASIKANQDAASERRSILNAQLTRDQDASDKTNQLVLNEAQNTYANNQRSDSINEKEQSISEQQQKDLQSGAGGGAGAIQTTGDAGNVSNDFLTAKADRALSEGNRLTSLAREIAKTRSVGGLLQDEKQRDANLASSLQGIASTNKNAANAAANDAGSVTTSPLGALGSLAGTIGAGMAANGFGAASSGAGMSGGFTGTGTTGFQATGGAGLKVPSGINWGNY